MNIEQEPLLSNDLRPHRCLDGDLVATPGTVPGYDNLTVHQEPTDLRARHPERLHQVQDRIGPVHRHGHRLLPASRGQQPPKVLSHRDRSHDGNLSQLFSHGHDAKIVPVSKQFLNGSSQPDVTAALLLARSGSEREPAADRHDESDLEDSIEELSELLRALDTIGDRQLPVRGAPRTAQRILRQQRIRG